MSLKLCTYISIILKIVVTTKNTANIYIKYMNMREINSFISGHSLFIVQIIFCGVANNQNGALQILKIAECQMLRGEGWAD